MSIRQCLWIWMAMSSLTGALVQKTKDSLVFGVLSKRGWVTFQLNNINRLSVCLCRSRKTQCKETTVMFSNNKSINIWRSITQNENLEIDSEDDYHNLDVHPVIPNSESTEKLAYFYCELHSSGSSLVCSREERHTIPCQINPCSVNLVFGCGGDTSAILVWKSGQQARVNEIPNNHIQDCCASTHTTTPISLYDDPALNTSDVKPTGFPTARSSKRYDSDNEISYTNLLSSLLSSLVYGDLQDTLIENPIDGMFISSENTTRRPSDTDLDGNQTFSIPVVDTQKTSFYLTTTHIGIIATAVIVSVLAILVILWGLKTRAKRQRSNKDNIEPQTHVNSLPRNLAQTSSPSDKFDQSYPREFKKLAEPSIDHFSNFPDQSPHLNDSSTNAAHISPTESLEVYYSTITKDPTQRTATDSFKSTKKDSTISDAILKDNNNNNKSDPGQNPLASSLSLLLNSQDSSRVETESFPSIGEDSNDIYWRLGERAVIMEHPYNTLSSDDDTAPALFQFTTLRFKDVNLALDQPPAENKPCQNSSKLQYITVYPQCSPLTAHTSNNKTNKVPVVYANIACNGKSKVAKDLETTQTCPVANSDAIIASELNENTAVSEVPTSDTKVNFSSQDNNANIGALYLNTTVVTNKTSELSNYKVNPEFNEVIYANTN